MTGARRAVTEVARRAIEGAGDGGHRAAAVPPAKKRKRSRARKTSDKPTRIWSLRILPPEDPDHRRIVDEQFFLAHQYRARLCEIEIALSDRFRQVDIDHPATRDARYVWEGQSQLLDALYADLRAVKAGTAPDDREDAVLRLQIVGIKPECTAAWRAVKAARELPEVAEHHAAAYATAREWAGVELRRARAEFSAKGLMHGTYVRVEDSVKQSVAATGRPPEFLRYEGEGSIGRQLPRSRDSSDVLHSVLVDDLYAGTHPYVRMTALPPDWEQRRRTDRRRVAKPYRGTARRQRHGDGWQEIPARLDGQYLEMQFGWKPAERSSTWVRFPLTQHRRLPSNAEILWIYVVRWRVGIHYEWRAQLTIESDTFRRPAVPQAAGGACAIDIGWRRILDAHGEQVGLRVAYLVDEHGTEREICAPDGLWQRLAKVYSLAQIRSRELEQVRDRLAAWILGRELPAWFTARRVIHEGGSSRELPALSAGLAQWRSPRKLQRLVDAWQQPEHRFVGDEEIFALLRAWAKQDRHLGQWQEHMRDRTLMHRREVWRQVAKDLAETYQTIIVEDGLCRSEDRAGQLKIVDIPGWERPAPEDGDPHEGREQRRQSRMAAPGELRSAIGAAAHKTASTVVDVAATRNSTCECAWCGHVQEHVSFAAAIWVRCEGCGRSWDQDANAARNLLHRRGLASGAVPPLPPTEAPASGPATPDDRRLLDLPKRSGSRRKSRDEARRGAVAAPYRKKRSRS